MKDQRTGQTQTSSNDFYLLLIKKLKSKGITLDNVLQFEQKSVFTKGVIAQRFEAYVQNEDHLYRVDKQGKRVALSRRYIFQKFANHYVDGLVQALGLEIRPLKQMRTLSKVDRLIQFVRQSPQDLEEPILL
ncbi:hypothetical protein [Leptolyngbya sp. GGD]|uniref:hypothetical protein n=1 Tax=Leptolyngbya sp. GGD TaxID=2997907 RepID=UPI00227B0226|nr:hypothetical protein [Leptolyngbya sp. GGD]MCY6494604.1 hypothetical protein [Leptolyngbya sp. GGD]